MAIPGAVPEVFPERLIRCANFRPSLKTRPMSLAGDADVDGCLNTNRQSPCGLQEISTSEAIFQHHHQLFLCDPEQGEWEGGRIGAGDGQCLSSVLDD